MVGRAAQGQPWLIQQLLSLYQPDQETLSEPDFGEKQQCMFDHVQALHLFYGEFTGIRMARKHMSWYLHHLNYGDQAVSQRQTFNHLGSAFQQLAFIKQLAAPSAKGKAA